MITGWQKELQSGFGKKFGISAQHPSLITVKVFASSIIAQSILSAEKLLLFGVVKIVETKRKDCRDIKERL